MQYKTTIARDNGTTLKIAIVTTNMDFQKADEAPRFILDLRVRKKGGKYEIPYDRNILNNIADIDMKREYRMSVVKEYLSEAELKKLKADFLHFLANNAQFIASVV